MYYRVIVEINDGGSEELWICEQCRKTYNELIESEEWRVSDSVEESLSCDMCDREGR